MFDTASCSLSTLPARATPSSAGAAAACLAFVLHMQGMEKGHGVSQKLRSRQSALEVTSQGSEVMHTCVSCLQAETSRARLKTRSKLSAKLES